MIVVRDSCRASRWDRHRVRKTGWPEQVRPYRPYSRFDSKNNRRKISREDLHVLQREAATRWQKPV